MFYNILDPRLKYVNDSQVRVVLFTHECGFSRLSAHHSSCTITGKAKKKLPLFSETDFIRRMSPGCCKQGKRRRSYTTHNFQNCDIDDKLWFILSRNILRIMCESSDFYIANCSFHSETAVLGGFMKSWNKRGSCSYCHIFTIDCFKMG